VAAGVRPAGTAEATAVVGDDPVAGVAQCRDRVLPGLAGQRPAVHQHDRAPVAAVVGVVELDVVAGQGRHRDSSRWSGRRAVESTLAGRTGACRGSTARSRRRRRALDHDGRLRHAGPVAEVEFSGEVVEWRGPAPFHFLVVPAEGSDVLRRESAVVSYGWGMIPADCEIGEVDRKSTRLNSSHVKISYAVFCLKKKKNKQTETQMRDA